MLKARTGKSFGCASRILAAFFGAYVLAGAFLTLPSTATVGQQELPTPDSSRLWQTTMRSDDDSSAAGSILEQAEKLRGEQRQAASEQAVRKYREAADVFNKQGQFRLAARAVRSAGGVLQRLGDTQAALSCYAQARAFNQKAGDSSEEARILNGIAYAHFLEGNTKAAYDNSLAALRSAERTGDRLLKAQALSTLAEAFYNFGDLGTSQKYQQQALQIFTDLGDHSGRALALIALAYYQSFLSKPREAIDLFQQGLDAAKRANDRHVQALAFNGLANVTAKLGNKQEALDSYLKASELSEETGDRICIASVLAGTGTLYFSMGDLSRAREYVGRAVTIFAQINVRWGIAETKLDLGRILHSLRDEAKALVTLTEALELFRSLGMRRLEAFTLREIGAVQTSTGDFNNARRSLAQALRLNRIGQDQRHEAYTLTLIGTLFVALNDRDKAARYHQQALDLSRGIGDPAGESNALFNIARIRRDQGNLVAAQQNVEAAITINESIRSNVSSHDLRASFLASVRDVYELYMDVLMVRHKNNPNQDFAAQAFAVSERAHARSLLDSLQEARTNIREGVDPTLLAKERSLNQALNEKAGQEVQPLALKDTVAAATLRREIGNLTSDYMAVRDQIRASSPKYAALTLPEPLTFTQVQGMLDDDSVLVEYALGDERSYAWVVSRGGLSVYQLAPRSEIEAAATQLRDRFVTLQAVSGESVEQRADRERKANEAMPDEIAVLSKLVLDPLAGSLGNKRLLIVADGALQYIPFHALNDPESTSGSSRRLIENHEIVYQPSASTLAVILKEANERKAAANTVAVFADPVFEVDDPRVKRASTTSTPESDESKKVRQALRDIGLSSDGVEIPRLLASGQEAEAIMESVPWGSGLKAVGFEATRTRVLNQDLTGYAIVHFATHGLINSEHPELSGIVLSLFDEQGRSQDGFLRLHDIYNLRLPADLVVLSACSTGLGKEIKGEGLVGLTRGFMYAGASSVVASLWKVDDDATAELMRHFYDAMLTKGLTPAAALRHAQLTMSRDKRWHSPYYWAGFVIQGRYDEQVNSRNSSLLTPSRIISGMGLLGFLIVTSVLLLHRRRA
jgi:CHAT domain-containing protein